MNQEMVLDEQLDAWRRKLADHEAALRDAGALAATGDVDRAARTIADATIGAQVARGALAAIEAQRRAAVAADQLAEADRLDAMAAELDAQAAPTSAAVAALIDQARALGVTLVRRGTQRDSEMQSQARAYRSEAAMLRVRSGKVL